MSQDKEDNIQIKPYTKAQLARMYGVSDTTFRTWSRPFLEQLPDYNRHAILLTTAQVSYLFEMLGPPSITKPPNHGNKETDRKAG